MYQEGFTLFYFTLDNLGSWEDLTHSVSSNLGYREGFTFHPFKTGILNTILFFNPGYQEGFTLPNSTLDNPVYQKGVTSTSFHFRQSKTLKKFVFISFDFGQSRVPRGFHITSFNSGQSRSRVEKMVKMSRAVATHPPKAPVLPMRKEPYCGNTELSSCPGITLAAVAGSLMLKYSPCTSPVEEQFSRGKPHHDNIQYNVSLWHYSIYSKCNT